MGEKTLASGLKVGIKRAGTIRHGGGVSDITLTSVPIPRGRHKLVETPKALRSAPRKKSEFFARSNSSQNIILDPSA